MIAFILGGHNTTDSRGKYPMTQAKRARRFRWCSHLRSRMWAENQGLLSTAESISHLVGGIKDG